MKRFILEQSHDVFYTSHSGLALAGLRITPYSNLPREIGRKMKNSGNRSSETDILRIYLGLLCLGKSDYEAITAMRDNDYFKNSLGITNVPSVERLLQRLEEEAGSYLAGKGQPTGEVRLDGMIFVKFPKNKSTVRHIVVAAG